MPISAPRRAYLRAYQLEWMTRRRLAWINANGPCAKCGSNYELEVDHIDSKSKDPKLRAVHTGALWSWSDARRAVELAKCQVLCLPCHKAKTAIELGLQNRKQSPAGMAWCSTCKQHKDKSLFSKNITHWNGLNYECRQCKKNYKDSLRPHLLKHTQRKVFKCTR